MNSGMETAVLGLSGLLCVEYGAVRVLPGRVGVARTGRCSQVSHARYTTRAMPGTPHLPVHVTAGPYTSLQASIRHGRPQSVMAGLS